MTNKHWDKLTVEEMRQMALELDGDRDEYMEWVHDNIQELVVAGWDYVELEDRLYHLPKKWQNYVQTYCELAFIQGLSHFSERQRSNK